MSAAHPRAVACTGGAVVAVQGHCRKGNCRKGNWGHRHNRRRRMGADRGLRIDYRTGYSANHRTEPAPRTHGRDRRATPRAADATGRDRFTGQASVTPEMGGTAVTVREQVRPDRDRMITPTR